MILLFVVFQFCDKPEEIEEEELIINNPLPGIWLSNGNNLSDYYMSLNIDSVSFEFDSTHNYIRKELTKMPYDDEILWLETAGTYIWSTDSLGLFAITLNEPNINWKGVFEVIADTVLNIEIIADPNPPNLLTGFKYSKYYLQMFLHK